MVYYNFLIINYVQLTLHNLKVALFNVNFKVKLTFEWC